MRPSDLEIVIPAAIRANHPMLFVGPPGVGKTDIILQCCEKADVEAIISHPVVADPTDYKGMPWVVDGKAIFLTFGDLDRIVDTDDMIAFFLDDLGQAPPVVQAATMQLILGRQINGHAVGKNVTFFAATNRKKDRAGVTGILEPVKSRFMSIVNFEINMEDWMKWAIQHNMPTELLAFIRFRPELLHQFEPDKDREDEMQNFPCPRTVSHVGDIINGSYPESTLYELCKGAAGNGFAAEFMSFRKIYQKLPNPDNVIKNPMKIKIPQDPATLYALTAALSARANKKTMENIIKFASRLNDPKNFDDNIQRTEFSVSMVRDCVRKSDDIQNTEAFIDWAAEHADVLIN